MTTGILGIRRLKVVRTSCKAAASGDVTIPICLGCAGMACLKAGSNRPSCCSFAFSFSKASNKAPAPAR